MVFRAGLVVAATVALAAVGLPSPAGADPHCSAGQCAPAPNQTPSYRDGYNSEHSFYSEPRNRNFLKSEMQQGYNTGMVCQLEIGGGAPPPSPADWMRGCIDALHDLGFNP
jgi:hypothetical protein